MLTFEDCLDYCELTLDEIDAVAAHEHSCRLQALALAGSLVQSDQGRKQLLRILGETLLEARVHNDLARERQLEQVIAAFSERHSQQRAS
ncbi:hypothetical protein [Motiliproteus sediminis]|uniref:hypothetical protein n=1 Tax=Motiliproteus sediminis TaxID=1468178 RepID=UPI001AEF6653|nr:hypothetical protein [Motiliproteus sediminis]